MASKQRVPQADFGVIWTRSAGSYNYATIDEYPSIDDTDYNYTIDPTHVDEFTFQAFDVPAGSVITNVKLYVRGKSSTSQATFAGSIWVGGTKYTGTLTDFTTSFTEVAFTWTNNPKTAAVWTIDEVNGIGTNCLQTFGYSAGGVPEVTRTVSRLYIEVNYTEGKKGSSFII